MTVRALADASLARFFDEEAENIASDVSERNLCGRLALIASDLLPQFGLEAYCADVEYNRKQGGQSKTIVDRDYGIISVTCDLIIHSRGRIVAQDNVLAFELKKSYRSQESKDSDRRRLVALTKSVYDDVWSADGITLPEHVCGYELGVYLEVDPSTRAYILEHYRNGERIEQAEGVF